MPVLSARTCGVRACACVAISRIAERARCLYRNYRDASDAHLQRSCGWYRLAKKSFYSRGAAAVHRGGPPKREHWSLSSSSVPSTRCRISISAQRGKTVAPDARTSSDFLRFSAIGNRKSYRHRIRLFPPNRHHFGFVTKEHFFHFFFCWI